MAKKTNKSNSYSTNNYKIGIKTNNGNYYGLIIGINKKNNYICTVLKNTKNGVEAFVDERGKKDKKKNPAMMPSSHPTAPVEQMPNSDVSHSQGSDNIIAYIKEQLNPSRQDVYQTQNIQDNFGQSVEELQEMFSEDIKNILAENEINSDEFEIEDVRLYGSYTTGKNKDTSDLDVIVQYKGSMKEDTAFNLLNDAKLTITDVNGIERKIDINPINSRLSGSIDEHIERMHEIDGTYFQSAATAGAETSAEIADAQKEWQEKGTDSKYFKKWFGDSKVVDENGHDTVLHSEKEHTLTSNEWKDLLSNIDNIESAVKSHQRPRYSGIPVLLKVKTNNGCYGVVLEIFQKNNPIITTAFTDVESEIDNWIKVEAIPNGTETTFSDTRLNNIITHFAPNFNQFQK